MPKKKLSEEFRSVDTTNERRIDLLREEGLDKDLAGYYVSHYEERDEAKVLWWAVQQGDLKALEIFLGMGFDPNKAFTYGLPLHTAAQRGNLEAVKILCANKKINIDINMFDKNSRTAIYLAVKYDHMAIVDYLLAKEAKIDIIKNKGDKSALELAKEKKTDLKQHYEQKIAKKLAGGEELVREYSAELKKQLSCLQLSEIPEEKESSKEGEIKKKSPYSQQVIKSPKNEQKLVKYMDKLKRIDFKDRNSIIVIEDTLQGLSKIAKIQELEPGDESRRDLLKPFFTTLQGWQAKLTEFLDKEFPPKES